MSAGVVHSEAERAVIWHDAECGGYGADVPIWRRLAEQSGGSVLEVGCGTGRVAIDLARRGHRVHAIDIESRYIEAVEARAAGLPVNAKTADLLELDLPMRFSLIAAPMQVVQLLGGAAQRMSAMERMRSHLEPSGVVALALVEGAPPEAQAPEEVSAETLPDVLERDGWVYSSLPLGVLVDGERMVVRRRRQLVSPAGDLEESHSEDRLDIVEAATLSAELQASGFAEPRTLEVPATNEHIGSLIVVAEVAP